MVKSIIYTLAAILLCTGFFIFTDWYVSEQFDDFYGALDALYDKIENEEASAEDANAVKIMWDDKKGKLHFLLPHNDISYIDYWLNEACGLLYNGNFELALGKIEVLREITLNLPDAYTLKLENLF